VSSSVPSSSSSSSSSSPSPAAVTEPPAGRWQPRPGDTWQYLLGGPFDLSADADVYFLDGEDTTAEQVRQVHAAGRRAVCYVNVGAFEDWRSDARAYPAEVLGEPLDGWAGERWVDVRRLDVLLPVLAARMDACRAKGFDAVEPDNVDGYANGSGFSLSAQDQLRFNEAVAALAHERGLAVGLKNDVEQVAALEPSFDFAVNEECLVYDECGAYAPFVEAGKPVFHVEYTEPSPADCARASDFPFSTIFKDVDLGPRLRLC
jgi:hypothetical protein